MSLDCVVRTHTVFAQSCDGHLFMILFFGYNAEMKINSKEIETALKFMPVVKINKEFNENVHRLDLREERENGRRKSELKRLICVQVFDATIIVALHSF